MLFILLSQSNQ